MNNFDTFITVYSKNLENTVRQHPEEYGFSVAFVPHVVDRMGAALEKGSYNKDGRALKATCKELGIPHTYAAINAYIKAVA